ncbi:hypothetical protein EDB87DRAFT_1633749 [Lactarius vividus]|nr:hypothetical protein EDB87DRAFT_1633749 [Lactarius vividus]
MMAGSTILVMRLSLGGGTSARDKRRTFEALYPTASGILLLPLLAHIIFSFRSANADSRNLVDSTTPVGGSYPLQFDCIFRKRKRAFRSGAIDISSYPMKPTFMDRCCLS